MQMWTNTSSSFIWHIGSYRALGMGEPELMCENWYGNLEKWFMLKEMTREEKFAFLAYVHFLSYILCWVST